MTPAHVDVTAARTFLFVPAHDARKVGGALASDADAVILDLEDAVPIGSKEEARGAAARVLAERGPGGPALTVRVNGMKTEFAEQDLEAMESVRPDAVVVPKSDRDAIRTASTDLALIPLIESAAGIEDTAAIASDARVKRLMLGSLDLAAELGLGLSASGLELAAARWSLVVASGRAGLAAPIDGVYPRHTDVEGLEHEAEIARRAGMRAKACIHPCQVPPVARLFAPDPSAVEWAERILAAWGSAGGDAGAIDVDGEMVDAPQVRRAIELRAAAALGNPARTEG